MKRRIIVIPFNAKFEGDTIDFKLQEKLQLEKAPIIGFAIGGAKRLKESKYQYTIHDSAKEAMQFLEEESSPVAKYAQEELEGDSTRSIAPLQARAFYEHYREWCKDNGYSPVASGRFAREFGNVDYVQQFKDRPRGTNLYYIHLPKEDVPPVINY
jgi:phage/plasmid-associated DNA primase